MLLSNNILTKNLIKMMLEKFKIKIQKLLENQKKLPCYRFEPRSWRPKSNSLTIALIMYFL